MYTIEEENYQMSLQLTLLIFKFYFMSKEFIGSIYLNYLYVLKICDF